VDKKYPDEEFIYSSDAMGHKNLLHCFLKDSKVGGKYDDHAVGCNICYGQAMLALLWKNAGASDEETLKGMERVPVSPAKD
jgi:hypothetical protein